VVERLRRLKLLSAVPAPAASTVPMGG
jgi:hypothetical protein